MKRIIILTLAIICGVAFSESFAKKPKKVDLKDSEQAERDKAERELDSLKSALSLYQEMLELEKERMELEREKAILKQRLQQEMEIPCQEEANGDENYYGALGISEGQMNGSIANRKAIQDALRQIATQIGDETIELNDYEVRCRQVFQDIYGKFRAYVAIRVPKKNITDKADSPSE